MLAAAVAGVAAAVGGCGAVAVAAGDVVSMVGVAAGVALQPSYPLSF